MVGLFSAKVAGTKVVDMMTKGSVMSGYTRFDPG